MALFHYKYIDLQGKKRAGIIDASHLEEAKQQLRSQGIFVISLGKGSTKIYSKNAKLDLSRPNLLNFTNQLCQLLSAGIPLYEGLLSLEEQYRSESFHPTIVSLCEQIKRGAALSVAMQQHPQSFDELYCAMIHAGESVGALDLALEKLSLILTKQIKLRKQIITAMIYPALLACFSLAIIFLLMTFAIPSMEAIFSDREVNGFTKQVIAASHFIHDYWHFYLPALGFLGYGIYLFSRSERGKLFKYKAALHLPLISKLSIQTALARFTRTMSTLQLGGLPIIQCLQISRSVMKNPILEEIFADAESKIVEGSSLSHELKKSTILPPLMPRMIAIGEESGNMAFMLQKIAELYEEEVEKSLTRIMALAQPVILIIMGAIVGIIMLAVLLPLTDISSFN